MFLAVLNRKREFKERNAAVLAIAQDNEIVIAIQVNGKLRGDISEARGAAQNDVQPQVEIIVAKCLQDVQVVKVIFVKDRLINFVIK